MNQRRGLGRGLGALIPSTPRQEPTATPVPDASAPGAVAERPAATAVLAEPELAEVSGVRYAEIAFDDVRPNPRQPRTVFDEEALAELVYSIREIGLLQPIVVRPVPDAGPEGPHYELVAGEQAVRPGSR